MTIPTIVHERDMTQDQAICVARQIMDRLILSSGDTDTFGLYHAPIVRGTVRTDATGADWARFGPHGRWFALTAIVPTASYPGARIVFTDDNEPLGSVEGPLMLSENDGEPIAFCLNTGARFDVEVTWS